jgi:dTDP-4-amino-4,6-dideoxygalactose transaminase
MDKVEDDYLVLPLHTKMTVKDVRKVCSVIKSGW